MKKKLLPLLFALTLCLTLLPTAALAADEGTAENPIELSNNTTWQAWNQAGDKPTVPYYVTIGEGAGATTYYLPAGKSYKLVDDVTLTGTLSTTGGSMVTLDLNGKTLTADVKLGYKNGNSEITNTLTLQDSVGGGELTGKTENGTTLDVVYGAVQLEGGTVSANGDNGVAIRLGDGKNLRALGGTVDGTVENHGTITSKILGEERYSTTPTVFTGTVKNGRSSSGNGGITGGIFYGEVKNGYTEGETTYNGKISGGTFYGTVTTSSGSLVYLNSANKPVNNGAFVFESGSETGKFGNLQKITDSNAASLLTELGMTGTGYVQVKDADDKSTYYSNKGAAVNMPTGLGDNGKLDLTNCSGVTWPAGCSYENGVLTLKDVILPGQITLPSGDITINISGTVIICYIYGENSGKMKIEGVQDSNPMLYVTGFWSIEKEGNRYLEGITPGSRSLEVNNLKAEIRTINFGNSCVPFSLNKSEILLKKGMSYRVDGYNDYSQYGLSLTESKLTVESAGSEFLQVDRIIMDDSSVLKLAGASIQSSGTISDGLNGLYDFLPDGYKIENYQFNSADKGPTIIDNKTNKPATDLTLKLQSVTKTFPFTVSVKQKGNVVPTEEMTFTLQAWDESNRKDKNALTDVTASGSVKITGENSETANLTLTGRRSAIDALFADKAGIYVRQVQTGYNEYWKIDPIVYYITMTPIQVELVPDDSDAPSPSTQALTDDSAGSVAEGPVYYIYEAEETESDGDYYYEPPRGKGDLKTVTMMTFTNEYTKNNETTPTPTPSVTRYPITATAGEGGSISPMGSVRVKRGSDKTFTVTASEGYKVSDVLVDGESIGAVESYTFENVRKSHTIEAVFEAATGVPAGLNGTDHIAYVQGYPDGTVQPDGSITRAEAATMLYRLLTPARRAEITTTSHSFTDLPATAWYLEAAASMANGGYLTGYPDGSFGGDWSITRAEFVAMLVRFIGEQEAACSFTDVPAEHWAYSFIATATEAGWLTGYEDGSFRPDASITRAEAMAIINRVLERGVDAGSTLLNFKSFPDNVRGEWYYYEVIEAANGHDYTGKRPSENWTALK